MMTAKGIAKLIEEMGELNQVLGKRLAYYTTEDHPDGGLPLNERMEDEIADVLAACSLVMLLHGLDDARIQVRTAVKLELFLKWEGDPTNNEDGIDAPRYPTSGKP